MRKAIHDEKRHKEMVIVQPSMVFGGTEKVLVNMLKMIDYSKWNVDLFLKERIGDLMADIPSEVHVFELPKPILSRKELLIYDFAHAKIIDAVYLIFLFLASKALKNEKINLELQKRCYPDVSKKRYDIAISYQGWFEDGNFFLLKGFLASKKYVWIHGEGNCNPLLMGEFDRLFCVSKGARDKLIEKYPSLESKTGVFYNFIDKDEIITKAEEPIDDMEDGIISIVSVGRLSPEKGFQMIPDIAKLLREDGFCFRWYIIGDGMSKEDIANACKEKHTDYVTLLGAKKNPYPYMKRCTIYVQPSFTEGFCTTTNEAKALYKPVVATDVSGMREQFTHGETGYIVEKATLEDLYRGIKYLLEHEEERERFTVNLKSNEKDEEYAKLRQLNGLLE